MSIAMIEDLRTDYKSDILMPVQQNKRTFNIVDSNNNILFENVHIEDNSQYLQVGDEYGSEIINEQNEAINALARGTGLTFDTYQDYLDARALGEVPVGSIIYILEGNQTVITADQVTYNSSNVKLALDALVSNLGSKSSASAVTGNDAFSKIATLGTNKANVGTMAEKSAPSNHGVTFKWTTDSYLEIYVDNTKVLQIKGFKKYD